jgi:hypothetical protein
VIRPRLVSLMCVAGVLLGIGCSPDTARKAQTSPSSDPADASPDAPDASVILDAGPDAELDAPADALHTCPDAACPATPVASAYDLANDSGVPGDPSLAGVFVVRRLQLGETALATWDGGPAASDWGAVSVDLDGLAFATPNTTGHCKPVEGGKKSTVVPDGPGGEDNSFAKNIVPILQWSWDAPSAELDATIAAGAGTLAFSIEPSGASAGWFPVVGHGAPPTSLEWETGTYAWAPRAELLTSTDPPRSGDALDVRRNGSAVMMAGTGKVSVVLPFTPDAGLVLELLQPVVIAELSGDGRSLRGILAGRLSTEELIASLKKFVGLVPLGCPCGSRWCADGAQVRQASDLPLTGEQDPMRTCDAISIGIGFEAVLGLLAAPADGGVPVEPVPCQ